MTTRGNDGPSLEQYVETRFNLLTNALDKVEQGVLVRIEHGRTMAEQAQKAAQLAIDKAEAAQAAHNVASNEWRGTLNDFKSSLVGRPEFEGFRREFDAYRLEASRVASKTAGESAGGKDFRESHGMLAALLIAAVAAGAALVALFK